MAAPAPERWRPVPIDPYGAAYEVSDDGRARRVGADRRLARSGRRGGHPLVTLSARPPGAAAGKRVRTFSLARLVALAFVGPPPYPAAVARPIDGDPTNCRADNLRWGGRGRDRTLSGDLAGRVRGLEGPWSADEVAARVGATPHTIRQILAGRTYREARPLPGRRLPPRPGPARPAPRLRGGPYAMPACAAGDTLRDAIRGPAPVVRISTGPIPWPLTQWPRTGPSGGPVRAGRPVPVLCGDLLAAIRAETAGAVCHHWAVSPATVGRWRRALGLSRGRRQPDDRRYGMPPEE